jgi:hypothetical protein
VHLAPLSGEEASRVKSTTHIMLRLVRKPPAEDGATTEDRRSEGAANGRASRDRDPGPELESDAGGRDELGIDAAPDERSGRERPGREPSPVSGTQVKRQRAWWVDEFVAIERRIRRALVRR